MTAEEARCGVAAALIGSQGAEMHVSSAATDHATGHCRLSEVSVGRGGSIETKVVTRRSIAILMTSSYCLSMKE